MATFNNYATLSYRGITTVSNLVTGEVVEALRVTKTAVTEQYTRHGHVTYVVSIVNSGAAEVAGLTLSDDLGTCTVGAGTVTPLVYGENSLKYYVNGVLQPSPAVTAGPPLQITGLSAPGGGSAILVYDTTTNEYAPLACGESIVNTAALSGGNLSEPIQASAEVVPDCGANLSISKFISPSVVPEDGHLTYTFVIANYGSTPTDAADAVTIADTFDPVLRDIAVTLDGTAMAPGQYVYTPATGAFSTAPGAVIVPGAVSVQEADTGLWTTTPGTVTLVVSGTI